MRHWLLLSIVTSLLLGGVSLASASAKTSSLRYLALGDSYTIGEGVEENSRWPVLLHNQLKKQGVDISPPEIIARTGWRTDDLYKAIPSQVLAESYDGVTLMIGVNDQYQGVDIESFTENLGVLIKQAIRLADSQSQNVLLISIPDWTYSPFGKSVRSKDISEQIDAFNNVLEATAEKYQLRFANVTDISRQVRSQGFTGDGLHPSQQQYQRWVDQAILPEMKRMLNLSEILSETSN